MKLKYKIMLFYGMMFIIPLLVITMANIKILTDSLLDSMEYSAGQGYEQSLSFLNYKLYRTMKLSDVVVSNREINDILTRKSPDYTIYQQIADMNTLRSYLQSLDERDVYHVKIYVDNSFIYSHDHSLLYGLSEADDAMWYRKKGEDVVYFSPGQYLEKNYEEEYVALVRNLVDRNHYSRRVGVVRIDMAKSNLEDILKKANPTNHSVTYLVNSDNVLVAYSDYGLMEQYGLLQNIPEELSRKGKEYESSLEMGSLEGDRIYYMKKLVDHTDWAMVTIIPHRDFMESIDKLRYLILGLVLIFGILTYSIGSLFISRVLKRISNLVDSMQEIKKGNMDVRLENHSKDEIGILYDNYNEMIQKTNLLLQEKYEMGKELKSAEIKALHSQINPHFLYNTLEMINWLGYGKRTEDIHSVVVSLSKFYRLTLNKGRELLTLEEELKHVGYYLNIESIRFSGKIRYEIQVDEEILGCSIPNVTLQPLVENAIIHGILEKKGKSGSIRIWGNRREDKVYLYVQDDGVGIGADQLEHLPERAKASSGSGYGIRNVNRRLQLLFGPEFGLTYRSEIGKGTRVIVCLPCGGQEDG
ncbi:MAG TPA: sensor histidine kinase [Clostridiales bacterium]|nr:sensor histidine kinase [Clostridiales bacterium]